MKKVVIHFTVAFQFSNILDSKNHYLQKTKPKHNGKTNDKTVII